MSTDALSLKRRLMECPPGYPGWKEFEDSCIAILRYLLVPPLTEPLIQPRTYSGIDRRDAVFPNRNLDEPNNWGRLYKELGARLVMFEFKNYDLEDIGKEEVEQTKNYMTQPMGRLSLVCCNKLPNHSAHIKRNTIFSREQKVILFLTKDHLTEMIFMKERGEEPSDLIMDLVERFYLQHE